MEPIQPIRETHIPVFFRHRDAGRLDSTWDSNDEAPSVETVCELVAQAPAASSVIIGGGEPTLRTDLPKLLSSLERTTTLATDGLVFHKANTVQHLAECGLTAVRLPLHSARADAYDWLTGIPGSHRRIRQAVACCIGLGIDVTAEVTLTRPTMPYLEETVAWLLREGVTSIRFRMLRRRGPATMEYITLAPRFGLLEPSLDAAIQLGLRNGVHIAVEGLPHCAVPRFPETRVPSPRWIVPDGIDCPPLNFVYSNHCDPCEANCEGAPSEYVDLFGRTEFSLSTDTKRVAVIASDPPRSGDEVAAPPARAARVPATRVSNAIIQAEQSNLGGDPMAGRAQSVIPETITICFDKDTRTIRKELVRLAQEGAHTLQIVGTMNHPKAHDLLRESMRLSFPRVILTADICGLEELPNNKLFQLRDLSEIWVPATHQNNELAQRIHAVTNVPILNFGILHSSLKEWANKWEADNLFGTPTFVLDPLASIEALQAEFPSLPDCPEKAAIAEALTEAESRAREGELFSLAPKLPPLTVQ